MSKDKQTARPPIPADGIERWMDGEGHEREICLTPESKEERRLTIWARCGGHCEGCRVPMSYSRFHAHHWRGRGMGGGRRCDCPECLQALCYDMIMTDKTVRPGCHTKVHKGRLGKPYRREDAA